MIFISKLLTALLLPPGCFFLALVLLTIFVPRKLRGFTLAVTLLLYILSIQPISDFLLRPLENAYSPLPVDDIAVIRNFISKEADALPCTANKDTINGVWPQAIVVLGDGTIQGSPEAGEGRDTLSPGAMKRVVYAFTLRDVYAIPFVFSGGKVFEHNQETEAAAAGRLFTKLGLPARRFIGESESRNTWENAKETAALFAERKPVVERAILVTSAYHVKRAVYCFERNGISVIPAPTDYKCDRGRKYDVLSFLPSMNSFRNSQLALHEYIGLLYYIIKYK